MPMHMKENIITTTYVMGGPDVTANSTAARRYLSMHPAQYDAINNTDSRKELKEQLHSMLPKWMHEGVSCNVFKSSAKNCLFIRVTTVVIEQADGGMVFPKFGLYYPGATVHKANIDVFTADDFEGDELHAFIATLFAGVQTDE